MCVCVCVCVCMTKSLSCTLESNTNIINQHISIKKITGYLWGPGEQPADAAQTITPSPLFRPVSEFTDACQLLTVQCPPPGTAGAHVLATLCSVWPHNLLGPAECGWENRMWVHGSRGPERWHGVFPRFLRHACPSPGGQFHRWLLV